MYSVRSMISTMSAKPMAGRMPPATDRPCWSHSGMFETNAWTASVPSMTAQNTIRNPRTNLMMNGHRNAQRQSPRVSALAA